MHFMTLEANCTAQYTEDDSDGNFTGGEFYTEDYSAVAFPASPSSDPLLPTDLTVAYSTATQDDDMLKLNIAAGKYVEIGERYLRVYTSAGVLDSTLAASGVASVPYNGVLDLTHGEEFTR